MFSFKMDQIPYPGPPLLFHIRMSILFLILWITDFIMFLIAVENTLANGVGGMVLFASEVCIPSFYHGFISTYSAVWYIGCQRHEHNLEIYALCV
jgi:hypothetical protein